MDKSNINKNNTKYVFENINNNAAKFKLMHKKKNKNKTFQQEIEYEIVNHLHKYKKSINQTSSIKLLNQAINEIKMN